MEAYRKKVRPYQDLSMGGSAYELAPIFSIVDFSVNFPTRERGIYEQGLGASRFFLEGERHSGSVLEGPEVWISVLCESRGLTKTPLKGANSEY